MSSENSPPQAGPPDQEPPTEVPSENGTSPGGMFGGRVIQLGKVLGIRFGVDMSWFLAFFVVTYSVGEDFGSTHSGWSTEIVWLSAICGSLLFFFSVLLHELGHSVAAISLGLPVRSITLFLFGGVAELASEPKRSRDEFIIALAGPVVSGLLAILFLAIFLLSPRGEPVGVVSMWLGGLNLVVAVFNMLPGYPLDGGRVFRAVLWGLTDDYERATHWSGRIGIILGNMLTALGLMLAIMTGRWLPGLALALLGWFLSRSARFSTIQALLRARLQSLRVRDAAEQMAPAVDGWDTLEEVIHQEPSVNMGGVLVLEEGVPVGALGPTELASTAPNKYAFHAARSVMTPLRRLVRIGPGDTLFTAWQLMEREKVSQLLIEQTGQVFGLLSRKSLNRALHQR